MGSYWSLGEYDWAKARIRLQDNGTVKNGTRDEILDLETIPVVVEIQVALIKQLQGRVI